MASKKFLNVWDGTVSAVGGAIVAVLIYSSSYFGDFFQALMSALPTSVILILYQYRTDRSKMVEMIDRVGRNELALASCVVTVLVFAHSFQNLQWYILSIGLILVYSLLILLFSRI